MNEPQTGTRAKLIAAGLHLFGRGGFEGTSTRALAERAGTNVASIAYHFGSKAGLRQACALHVVERLGNAIVMPDAASAPPDPQAALQEIEAAMRAFARMLLVSAEAGDFVPFVLRELTDPGDVAEQLFTQFFQPRHARFCTLWSAVTGKPAEAAEVKLAVFTFIGQILYFRIARSFVARRMEWGAIGPSEVDQIVDAVLGNLRAAAERGRT